MHCPSSTSIVLSVRERRALYVVLRTVCWLAISSSILLLGMVVNASVHKELGDKLLVLADALLAIHPNCNVWIHEKQLYKLLKIKKGLNFGQRDCLSSIISGIDKGRWGEQRNPAVKRESGPIAGFASGNSDNSRVRFQEYGRPEQFEGGTNAVGGAKLNVPRYFVFGK